MLLFVVAALTIFHFALPTAPATHAALGLLWVALVFTALLGLTRAFVAEREQGDVDALVLAPCDRSAIWLGEVARGVRVPRSPPSSSRCPRSPRSSRLSTADGRRGRARRRRDLRRRHAHRRDGGRRRARASCSCRCSSCRSRCRSSSAGWAQAAALPLVPGALRRAVRAARLGDLRVRRRRDVTPTAAGPETTIPAVRARGPNAARARGACTRPVRASRSRWCSSTPRPTPTRDSRSASSTSTFRSR